MKRILQFLAVVLIFGITNANAAPPKTKIPAKVVYIATSPLMPPR